MLKVIVNRLKPLAENLITEGGAGFRAGQSATEHIFNLRISCGKYDQCQQHSFLSICRRHLMEYGVQLSRLQRKNNVGRCLVFYMSLHNCV